jgi:hypothetical protein
MKLLTKISTQFQNFMAYVTQIFNENLELYFQSISINCISMTIQIHCNPGQSYANNPVFASIIAMPSKLTFSVNDSYFKFYSRICILSYLKAYFFWENGLVQIDWYHPWYRALKLILKQLYWSEIFSKLLFIHNIQNNWFQHSRFNIWKFNAC